MRELVEFIVNSLVDNKNAVNVTIEDVDGVSLITVNVADEDIGKVIGKKGKIINSIRTIVNANNGEGKYYRLVINDNEDAE